MADSKYTKALANTKPKTALQLDKRFYDTIFAEAGGGPAAEVAATVSVYMNRARKEGYEKALKGSAAYNTKSKQYKKAESGKMNSFEKIVYKRNKAIIDTLAKDEKLVAPFYYHENVRAFGEPKWAGDMKFQDIGRQRFYIKED